LKGTTNNIQLDELKERIDEENQHNCIGMHSGYLSVIMKTTNY